MHMLQLLSIGYKGRSHVAREGHYANVGWEWQTVSLKESEGARLDKLCNKMAAPYTHLEIM